MTNVLKHLSKLSDLASRQRVLLIGTNSEKHTSIKKPYVMPKRADSKHFWFLTFDVCSIALWSFDCVNSMTLTHSNSTTLQKIKGFKMGVWLPILKQNECKERSDALLCLSRLSIGRYCFYGLGRDRTDDLNVAHDTVTAFRSQPLSYEATLCFE